MTIYDDRSLTFPGSTLRRFVLLGTCVLLLGLAPLTALSQETGADDDATIREFGDWRMRCEAATDENPERCFMFQNLVLKEGNRQLLNLAIGYPKPDKPPVAILMLPLGISLPAGVEVQVDEGISKELPFEHCIPAGCRAAFPLDEDWVKGMKLGNQAKISFHDGARRPISLPVSLAGFTAGFKALTAKNN